MAIWRISCRLEWDGPGSPGFNVFHARSDDLGGPNPNAVIGELANFYTDIAWAFPESMIIRCGDVMVDVETDENVSGAPQVVQSTGGSTDAPELLQIVIPWRTTSRTRRGSGRTFIGPLNAGQVGLDGNPQANTLADLGTAADGLLTASQNFVGGAFGVWGYQDAATDENPRQDDDPRVLRDWVARGSLRATGFSYLSSRRD